MARNIAGTGSINCGTALLSGGTSTITLSCWVYLNSTSNDLNQLWAKNSGANIGLLYQVSTTTWSLQNGSTAAVFNTVPGQWYHITATNNGGTGFLYINGALKTSGAWTWSAQGATTFAIGYDPSFGRNWNGRLADFGFWNATLTAAEALALASGARPYTVRPSSLAGYWPLDGLQSPEPDLSGGLNNGTLTGTSLAAGPPISLFTGRKPQAVAAPASAIVFRRSFSQLGTRGGSRQGLIT